MYERILKMWKDPVWSKVIASAIFGIILSLYLYAKSVILDTSFIDILKSYRSRDYAIGHIVAAVGIVLLIQLIIRKVTKRKFSYNDATLESDRKFFQRLKEHYLPQDSFLKIKQHGFSSHGFKSELLLKLHEIIEENDKPDFEFINPQLEQLKQDLVLALEEMKTVMAYYIFGSGHPEYLSIPKEWETDNPKQFEEAQRRIHQQEENVSTAYDKFVRVSRRILNV